MTIGARLSLLLGPPGSSLRRWRLFLLAALALLGAWLVGPYPPWRLPGRSDARPGPGQSRIHIVLVATWWAAAVNAVLCALLLATSGFWAGDERDPLAAHAAPGAARPAASVALLLGAAALAGALRWPLAHGSVWWDEAWSVRHVIVGTLKPDAADRTRLEFSPCPGSTRSGTTASPRTTCSTASPRAPASPPGARPPGAAPQEWDEFALRFPAFAAAAAVGLPARPAGARPRLPARRARGRRAARDPPLAHPLRRRRPRLRVHGAVRDLRRLVPAPRAARRALALVARLRGVAARAALGPSRWPSTSRSPSPAPEPSASGVGPGARATTAPLRARALRRRATRSRRCAYLQLMAPNLAQSVVLSHEWAQQPEHRGPARPEASGSTSPPASTCGSRASPTYTFPTLQVIWGGGRDLVRLVVYGVLPALAAIGLRARAAARRGPRASCSSGSPSRRPSCCSTARSQDFLVIERFAIYGLVAVVPAAGARHRGRARGAPTAARMRRVGVRRRARALPGGVPGLRRAPDPRAPRAAPGPFAGGGGLPGGGGRGRSRAA